MPLCALCKLEFNCRVSSMGMEVSASYKQEQTFFNSTLFRLRHLNATLRELRQREAERTLTFSSTQRLRPLNVGLMPTKVTANFTSLVATVHLTYVGCEGSAHEFLPLSLLGLSGIASMLEILQGGPKVLDIIL